MFCVLILHGVLSFQFYISGCPQYQHKDFGKLEYGLLNLFKSILAEAVGHLDRPEPYRMLRRNSRLDREEFHPAWYPLLPSVLVGTHFAR